MAERLSIYRSPLRCRTNSETVLAYLDKRLQSTNPRVQMHALTVRTLCDMRPIIMPFGLATRQNSELTTRPLCGILFARPDCNSPTHAGM
jgi:hypothetical protein